MITTGAYGDFIVSHGIFPSWSIGNRVADDPALVKTLNAALKKYSVEELRRMSGNEYLNQSVYCMNTWITGSSAY